MRLSIVARTRQSKTASSCEPSTEQPGVRNGRRATGVEILRVVHIATGGLGGTAGEPAGHVARGEPGDEVGMRRVGPCAAATSAPRRWLDVSRAGSTWPSASQASASGSVASRSARCAASTASVEGRVGRATTAAAGTAASAAPGHVERPDDSDSDGTNTTAHLPSQTSDNGSLDTSAGHRLQDSVTAPTV